jgi:hypothetical protein
MESDPELDPDPVPDPDALVKGADPGIQIRTKMSRIPNTASPNNFSAYRYYIGTF